MAHEVYHSDPAVPMPPLDASQQATFVAYIAELRTSGRTRRTDPDAVGMAFQHLYCGETEYRITPDEDLPNATWADDLDLDDGLAVDAKETTTDGSSFYLPETITSPFMRKIAEEKNDHRLAKYGAVIKDSDNPIRGLEILTNSPDSAQYFRGRLQALEIPGRVVVVPGVEEETEQ